MNYWAGRVEQRPWITAASFFVIELFHRFPSLRSENSTQPTKSADRGEAYEGCANGSASGPRDTRLGGLRNRREDGEPVPLRQRRSGWRKLLTFTHSGDC